MKSSLSQCVEAIEEVGNRLSNWLSFFLNNIVFPI